MGFVAAVIGAAASASSSAASESMQQANTMMQSAAENGMQDGISGFASRAAESAAAEMADDTMDIRKAAEESAVAENQNEPKNFFSRAWDESKQAAGIGNGADMGKVGYNLGKMAVSKGDSSEPPKMDQAPVQTSAPSAPVTNAEDELNKLRNRMNVS